MTTIATICARGGSKGLPGKNSRLFAGKPLIVHTIEQALATPSVDAVYVSTDDPDIATIAVRAGAVVPYVRPAFLAHDLAPKLPVIEHLVAHLERGGACIDRIVDLQPTSPVREPSDIAQALLLQAPLVLSVSLARDNPYFNLVESDAAGRSALSKGLGNTRRQDAPTVYALNGSIYVWQRHALAQAAASRLWDVEHALYVMPRWKSVDIDDLDDFDYAQWLYARHLNGGHHVQS
jgi:N-acylneuraminate cytidylyltransferase